MLDTLNALPTDAGVLALLVALVLVVKWRDRVVDRRRRARRLALRRDLWGR